MGEPIKTLGNTLPDWVVAFVVLAIFVGLGVAVLVGGGWVIRKLWKVDREHPLAKISRTVQRLLALGLFITGLYFAVGSLQWWQGRPRLGVMLDRVFASSWVVIAILLATNIINTVLDWYLQRISTERPERGHELQHHLNLVRKFITMILGALGLLYLLRSFGVDITPLIAGGAIGGLVLGLALQDTLSDLFAGFFLNVDRPIKVGDFVKVESGEEGFVEEIGWRRTKIRLLSNNFLIIPNSKLSKSLILNYSLPESPMFVYVPCGVAYDSDLNFVEQVTLEVARKVQREVQGADPNWEPAVRWTEFGDFAITFVTVLRALNFTAQYNLRSEFIKSLHRRFKEVGIEIPFPIQTVILKSPLLPTSEGSFPKRSL